MEVTVESGGSGNSYISKLYFRTALARRIKRLPDKRVNNAREDFLDLSLVTFLVDGGAGTSSKKVDKTVKMREVNSLAI